MTYEKAELILQQLMGEDRDYYLVRSSDGKPQVTDCPVAQQRVIEKLPKNRPKWYCRLAVLFLGLLVPTGVATHRSPVCEVRARVPARKQDSQPSGGIDVTICAQ